MQGELVSLCSLPACRHWRFERVCRKPRPHYETPYTT